MPHTQPLFLARRSYRRRRMMDAVRLLPGFGAVLIMLPLLWRTAETPEPDTAEGLVYLFAVWVLLIAAAFALSRGLAPALLVPEEPVSPEAGEPGENSGEAG
ncbi:MAG: hypothetical protein Q8Q63_10495 [Phaeovulum sp.]|jgi:hypothetical protein|nr:hypothetical protein [Phaeovulum sp.]MDP1670141.1 hypothetical protein [Phaeovulum sp.]MDP2064203.1 hypothetical protein [Phaeovulum sp.]MDP3861997.1 hypothetical protein [Phaeovulum sp.]MDZ4120363.1 hypothetical protein [Phaeovulum sp.]